MTDQCIICLDDLQIVLIDPPAAPPDAVAEVSSTGLERQRLHARLDGDAQIAEINPCGHILHDECLREWSQKANSCPICRAAFNVVQVWDKVGGGC